MLTDCSSIPFLFHVPVFSFNRLQKPKRAMAKISVICLALFCLIAVFLVTSSTAGGEGSVPIQECPEECARRCAVASQHEECLKYCNLCCQKCLCVPSGTSGHKEECPCYRDWRSSQGKPKCP
uniref:Gibberellin regulated protein n=1 Tax=Opuntia streptacantha TaxID=393608 RepID=A0A7C9DDA9_OPUST